MWSRAVAALEPGQSVQVLLMGIPGESPLVAVVDASWSALPGGKLRRKSIQYELAKARTIETRWPGKSPD